MLTLAWVGLCLARIQEEPEVTKVLRPTRRSVVAFIRAADPKKTPEVQTDRGAGTWTAYDAERGAGILEVPPEASEIRVTSGGKTSAPASLGENAAVRWEDKPSHLDFEPIGTAVVRVTNRGEDCAFAYSDEDERRTKGALILRPGASAEWRAEWGRTVIAVRESGAAWRGALPFGSADAAPSAEQPRGWGFVPFGEFRFSGIQGEGSLVHWPDFEPENTFRISTQYTGLPVEMDVDTGEFRSTLGRFSVGFTVESFEVNAAYLFGEGRGDGTFGMPAIDTTGKLEYDVDLQGGLFSLSRPIFGYDGPVVDFLLGSTVGLMILRKKFQEMSVTPDDPLMPSEKVAGSKTETNWSLATFLWAAAFYRLVQDPVDLSLRVGVGRYWGDGEGLEFHGSVGVEVRF